MIMYLGFFIAAYSVIANDVIQTLGTFLSSNEKKPWWSLWLFASIIIVMVLFQGWLNGDITYGRLDKFDLPEVLEWYYLLPPIILLMITRLGVPVSTTFLILTLFALGTIEGNNLKEILSNITNPNQQLGKMVKKSVLGYGLAFSMGWIVYQLISRSVERKFIKSPIKKDKRKIWTLIQWLSTGYLWYNWLTQDLANIYVYLLGSEKVISITEFIFSIVTILALMAFIFYRKGGAIQQIVLRKTNTIDIRSATIIDFIFALILKYFKDVSNIPMSTTWVFIGLLAGRELAIKISLEKKVPLATIKDILYDLGRVFLGLIISILLVLFIKLIS